MAWLTSKHLCHLTTLSHHSTFPVFISLVLRSSAVYPNIQYSALLSPLFSDQRLIGLLISVQSNSLPATSAPQLQKFVLKLKLLLIDVLCVSDWAIFIHTHLLRGVFKSQVYHLITQVFHRDPNSHRHCYIMRKKISAITHLSPTDLWLLWCSPKLTLTQLKEISNVIFANKTKCYRRSSTKKSQSEVKRPPLIIKKQCVCLCTDYCCR